MSDSAAADYSPLGTQAGRCHHCHTGECPVGISTQDALPEQRLRRKSAPPAQLPVDVDDGTDDAGARLRQARCASPGTRRSGRFDGRRGGQGGLAAGRNELDPGRGTLTRGALRAYALFVLCALSVLCVLRALCAVRALRAVCALCAPSARGARCRRSGRCAASRHFERSRGTVPSRAVGIDDQCRIARNNPYEGHTPSPCP